MNVKLIIIVAGVMVTGCTKNYDDVVIGSSQSALQKYNVSWDAAADSAATAVTTLFWNVQDKYFNKNNVNDPEFHYWPQAHALDVVLDAQLRKPSSKYTDLMTDWLTGVKVKNGNTYINEFYDDMQWIALATLRAYDVTGNAAFKAVADELWTDIKGGWNETVGGGISWRKAQPYYKNTPANAPAVILAARLYQHSNSADDLQWAQKIYDWLKNNLYEPGSGLVYDGINRENNGALDNWKFTYNQGVFIGAALELYNATKNTMYLNDAIKAAGYTLSDNTYTNSTDRLLRDEGGGDGGLFKGIFIRYFTQLILHPDLPDSYRQRFIYFVKHNAEWLWFNGTNKQQVLFGSYWKNKPGNETDLTIQLSGAMLIEAAALLNKNELF
ncbi:MAG: alpha-1,6-mannanase [Chitinophagaceae bacterium]|nr:alpha-1,6-mannanase [Chitinophagaceae bacterium]